MEKTIQTPTLPRTEAEIVHAGLDKLRERLPPDWLLIETRILRETETADIIVLLRSPDGRELNVAMQSRAQLRTKEVPWLRDQFDRFLASRPEAVGMVASQYINKPSRESLEKAGLSYVDATGNIFFRAGSPAVFISDRGADSDPWRGPGRPKGTLKGAPAARVARALLDFEGPWKIRDLVAISQASTGSVYRVLEFLESEGLANRQDGGKVTVLDWAALLRRWSDDYQFFQTNSVSQWIAPRGIESFLDKVRQNKTLAYAVTGSIAAANWAPYAPVRSAMIYSQDPEQAAEGWGLRPTDTGANVFLARPAYEILNERAIERADGLRLAAPAQVATDLITGPGRAPSEAEELIDWMKRNENEWR